MQNCCKCGNVSEGMMSAIKKYKLLHSVVETNLSKAGKIQVLVLSQLVILRL